MLRNLANQRNKKLTLKKLVKKVMATVEPKMNIVTIRRTTVVVVVIITVIITVTIIMTVTMVVIITVTMTVTMTVIITVVVIERHVREMREVQGIMIAITTEEIQETMTAIVTVIEVIEMVIEIATVIEEIATVIEEIEMVETTRRDEDPDPVKVCGCVHLFSCLCEQNCALI